MIGIQSKNCYSKENSKFPKQKKNKQQMIWNRETMSLAHWYIREVIWSHCHVENVKKTNSQIMDD